MKDDEMLTYRNTHEVVIPKPFTKPMYFSSVELFNATFTAKNAIDIEHLSTNRAGTNAYHTYLKKQEDMHR